MKKLLSRNFVLYAVGRFVSLLGSGVQNIAIPLYILRTTGSGLTMGLYAFVQLLPEIFLMPIGGVIGDNFNRKHVMIIMDFLSGIIALSLAFSIVNNLLPLSLLFICQIFLSSFLSIFDTSNAAMLPEIVPEGRLLKGNSIIGSIDSMTHIAGPILGAALFGLIGLKIIFFINGVSFIISGISEIFINYEPHKKDGKKLTIAKSRKDIMEGFKFLKKSKGIMSLISFAAITNFFGIACLSVILPFIFIEKIEFTDEQFGLIQASIMAGLLLGNILLSLLSDKFDSKKIVTVGLISEAIIFLIIGIFVYPSIFIIFGGPGTELFIIFSILLFGFGISNGFLKTTVQTNMQLLIPNELRARVLSAYSFSMQVISPIGVLLAGIAIELVKYYNLFMFCVVMIIIATVMFIYKAPDEAFNPKIITKKESV